jgi:RsiW-degrading membrane proteinase PrsW (M82 family)
MQYIAIALAPGIAICIFILYKDIYNREPRLNLFVSFILGCLAIIPAIIFETVFEKTVERSLTGVAVFAWCIVAFSEEFSKFLGLRFYSYRQRSFDEPLDGIVYSVMVSMGFATLENLLYVLNYAQMGRGMEVGIQRMFLSVPAHASFGVVMGYFAGKAKFNSRRSFLLLLTGLLIAIFFHGTFDFFLFIPRYTNISANTSEALLAGGAIASYIICLLLSRKMLKWHRILSKKQAEEKNNYV